MSDIDKELRTKIAEKPGCSRGELIGMSELLQSKSKQYIGIRLGQLVKDGMIRKEGSRKGTKYYPHSLDAPDESRMMSSDKIIRVFDEVKQMVVAKNQAYGDSVFAPLRVFYRGGANPADLIRIRMDDKISRLIQGNDGIENDEDVIKDLMGYCAILLVTMREGQTRLTDYVADGYFEK